VALRGWRSDTLNFANSHPEKYYTLILIKMPRKNPQSMARRMPKKKLTIT